MNMGRKIAGVIAVIGWVSLLLQFVLQMTNPIVPEPAVLERFVRFFSYFTITTNIIVAATLTAIAFFPATRIGRFASKPSTQAAVASTSPSSALSTASSCEAYGIPPAGKRSRITHYMM